MVLLRDLGHTIEVQVVFDVPDVLEKFLPLTIKMCPSFVPNFNEMPTSPLLEP